MKNTFDIIIIGAGPAGLSAGLYAKRLGLDAVIFEKLLPGGQVLLTDMIDNYPGFEKGIYGYELVEHFTGQVKALDVPIVQQEIIHITKEANTFSIETAKEKFYAKAVIISSGVVPRRLGIPSEAKFLGKGISYCAVCDGPIYRNKVVCVVGGGDRALEEAVYLSRICSQVYLVHRRAEFRAFKVLQDEVSKASNIKQALDSVIEEFIGDNALKQIKVKNVKTGAESVFNVQGAFIAVGTSPNTKFLHGFLGLDEEGFIKTDEFMKTPISGLFAAGDVRVKTLRQVVTATADGAIAAFNAFQYISSL